MRITHSNGKSYNISGDGSDGPSNGINLWLGKSGKFMTKPIAAMIDSGASMALTLPWTVLMDLQEFLGHGLSSKGIEQAEVANGEIVNDILVTMDLRLKTSTGATVIFSDVAVSVTQDGSMILLGMGLLEHLDLIFKNGRCVHIDLGDPTKTKVY